MIDDIADHPLDARVEQGVVGMRALDEIFHCQVGHKRRRNLRSNSSYNADMIQPARPTYPDMPQPVFPLRPALPLPQGISEQQLFDFVTSVRVENSPEAEMCAYGTNDFCRFVYTWGLASDVSGKCLELGANPYFTTMLLKKFTPMVLSLANYFGSLPNGEHAQNVEYCDFTSGRKAAEHLLYQHFNVEKDPFPYPDAEFDLVIFAEIIEHLLNDPCTVLREIRRVLRPGGTIILTTPNVARLENVVRLFDGVNIYDPYSGYGPYGRHNREYSRHELVQLMQHEGFEPIAHFTADVSANSALAYPNLPALAPLLKFREHDLGQYVFVKAIVAPKDTPTTRPAWLYRSYAEGALA